VTIKRLLDLTVSLFYKSYVLLDIRDTLLNIRCNRKNLIYLFAHFAFLDSSC